MSILRLLGNKGTLPFFSYRSSKAAANMVVKSLAVDLKEKGITSVAFNPDWVKRSGLTNWDSPLSVSLAQPKPCTEHGVRNTGSGLEMMRYKSRPDPAMAAQAWITSQPSLVRCVPT